MPRVMLSGRGEQRTRTNNSHPPTDGIQTAMPGPRDDTQAGEQEVMSHLLRQKKDKKTQEISHFTDKSRAGSSTRDQLGHRAEITREVMVMPGTRIFPRCRRRAVRPPKRA